MEVWDTVCMNKVWADRKPLVSEVESWTRIYHSPDNHIQIYEASNYYDFFKCTVKGKRSRLFFGETAHMDVQRYALDNGNFNW